MPMVVENDIPTCTECTGPWCIAEDKCRTCERAEARTRIREAGDLGRELMEMLRNPGSGWAAPQPIRIPQALIYPEGEVRPRNFQCQDEECFICRPDSEQF